VNGLLAGIAEIGFGIEVAQIVGAYRGHRSAQAGTRWSAAPCVAGAAAFSFSQRSCAALSVTVAMCGPQYFRELPRKFGNFSLIPLWEQRGGRFQFQSSSVFHNGSSKSCRIYGATRTHLVRRVHLASYREAQWGFN